MSKVCGEESGLIEGERIVSGWVRSRSTKLVDGFWYSSVLLVFRDDDGGFRDHHYLAVEVFDAQVLEQIEDVVCFVEIVVD